MNLIKKSLNYRFLNYKNINLRYSTGNDPKDLFFDSKIQNILKYITDKDYSVVFQRKKDGQRLDPPQFKFMTEEQYQNALKDIEHKSEKMLQMPPVVPPRQEINHTLAEDKRLIGYSECKFVFTDISFGKKDHNRCITVRDPDGTLRMANCDERFRMNEIYFPREGRQLRTPELFKPQYFKIALDKEEYEFILDRACAQFDPDDPTYIKIRDTVFDDIHEKQKFLKLRSTRHFGPMVFYLALNNKVYNILDTYINTDRLNHAVQVIKLYLLLHPDIGLNLDSSQDLDYIQDFAEKVYPDKSLLHNTIRKYKNLVHKTKNEAVV